ncbi:cinnamoyl-CoA reductase [Colletotrichum plurivorum]|uniref:Cinnamoyl-CoA reductase n=1 Tax=Colletotrichum plurivorum TaxID=2175906 RepID=A0A8H6JRN8_9PEZI|nr:cinnamoyl-CoA reductase [Colletotrichum plurivorum]
MPASKTPRTIVVVGATGNQGGGVVRALLSSSSSDWHVRALTRDPTSSKAKALVDEHHAHASSGRLVLVQGHVYDRDSLRSAFADAHGVFAITAEICLGKTVVEEADMAHEIEAGRNMVAAAEEAGVRHFVFSSLPDMVEVTAGRFPGIHHMNNKHAVERIAREHLGGVTCLIPGFFYTNVKWPHYSKRLSNGVVRFCTAIPKVFDLGVSKTAGKIYLVMSPPITSEEMVETFTRVTGQAAVHDPITPREFGEATVPLVGPGFQSDAQQMMEWASVTPADKICFGAMEPHEDISPELGLKASSFEEWLLRSGWKGPE